MDGQPEQEDGEGAGRDRDPDPMPPASGNPLPNPVQPGPYPRLAQFARDDSSDGPPPSSTSSPAAASSCWYGTGVSAAELTDVRRRLHELGEGTGKAERLTLATAAFLTPPGIPAVTSAPGRPLGGDVATAASVVDDLGRLAESGLTTCTLWLPIAAEHVEKAMEWVAAEVAPQLS